MGTRDRRTISIKCPKCGNAGEVEVSQEDGWAFMRDQSTSVDRMPNGFSVKNDGGSAASMSFTCDADGEVANKS